MSNAFTMTLPGVIVDALKQVVREAVAEELEERATTSETGFLDVDGAADFLAATSTAIRSLVKRDAIPYHKAPNGRLLFDREELRHWATSGCRAGA